MHPSNQLEIVGVAEIAEILAIPTNHVSMMISRMTIPEADFVINAGRTKVWLKSTIMDWAINTGKLPIEDMLNFDIKRGQLDK
mgnify:CR=1 FL=1